MSAVDHRVKVTKMLIRKAFTELLKQKPIQSISVKELCAVAGINRGTFYKHYTDIYDLLSKLEDDMLEDFQAALNPLLGTDAGSPTPLEVITGIFQTLKDNADICTVTLGAYGDKEFAAKLINIGRVMYGEAYTRLFQGVTPRELDYYYAFVSAGCIGLLEEWLAEGMSSSAQEMAEIAESIMVQGIGFFQRKTK